MSGHSKWSKIKRKKGAADSKRSSLFTKLANAISIAAREGSDPNANFKLRMAIDQAKSFSLPKENIERAIKKGAGELAGSQIEEITFEGFGPEGIAFVIEVITDNRNRAVADVKHLLAKYGGSLGGPGSVMWMFEHKGVIALDKQHLTEAEELELIDAGVEDIDVEDGLTLYTSIGNFKTVKEKVEALNLPILEAGPEFVAKEKVKPTNENSLLKLYEDLDDSDDINNFYTNADL
ncbi:YebC/PmpR family DNA-binding transcriptional regulator [Patescibacteria group bacterium]|nr:YebC/PmpR family DNA-binding transcriptional regulator [Patescibacteria group bacterium]